MADSPGRCPGLSNFAPSGLRWVQLTSTASGVLRLPGWARKVRDASSFATAETHPVGQTMIAPPATSTARYFVVKLTAITTSCPAAIGIDAPPPGEVKLIPLSSVASEYLKARPFSIGRKKT